jgi:uncharacterized Zn ribbon protein
VVYSFYRKEETMQIPKCPECGSQNVQYTRTNKKYWCRRCGKEWSKVKTIKEIKDVAGR